MTLSGSGAKWLVGGAVVSLCINLFLVGLMAGHWIYGPPRFGPGGPGGPGRGGMEAMIGGLPEEVRPIFKQEFGAARAQFDSARDQVRAARDKVEQAAEADPFDPAAFDAAFDELQTAMDGIQKIAHQTIGRILPQISAKQRHDLVEQWSKRWDRDHK
ncbi:MAG TPA: periplasmic heavy metal sensor [Dongiaceae bacterium]|jgi:uncharacterized membrane protein|nr:periplasmic heavy metal sensor [Dongiaceae bacterium]